MNGVRAMVVASVVAVGGLGVGASPAQAQSRMGMGGGPALTYSYAPGGGYYRGGYSYAPRPTVRYYGGGQPSYRSPARSGSRGRSYAAYDPSGRHDGLARPWLQPLR